MKKFKCPLAISDDKWCCDYCKYSETCRHNPLNKAFRDLFTEIANIIKEETNKSSTPN